MSTLAITKTYQDGDILLASDLDYFKSDVETFLNTTKLTDENFQAAGIDASEKIENATLTSAKFAANVVTTAKIADSAVTTAKIADSNITTAKIADGVVTRAKQYAITPSTQIFSNSSTSTSEVSLATTSVTTGGRPVLVSLTYNDNSQDTAVGKTGNHRALDFGNVMELTLKVRLYRDATLIYEGEFRCDDDTVVNSPALNFAVGFQVPAGAYWTFDTPAAGTYTYAVKYIATPAHLTHSIRASLHAYEV